MLLWFAAALIFRWRFQFSLRSLLRVGAGCGHPVQLAGDGDEGGEESRTKAVDDILKVIGQL